MKNKKSLSALISLAAIVLVVGTLAYFSRDLTVENRLKTAKYDTTIEEEFIPTDKWAPGVEINKKVTVKNTGNVDIVVRAKLTELWKRSENLMDPNDPDKILSEEGEIHSLMKTAFHMMRQLKILFKIWFMNMKMLKII